MGGGIKKTGGSEFDPRRETVGPGRPRDAAAEAIRRDLSTPGGGRIPFEDRTIPPEIERMAERYDDFRDIVDVSSGFNLPGINRFGPSPRRASTPDEISNLRAVQGDPAQRADLRVEAAEALAGEGLLERDEARTLAADLERGATGSYDPFLAADNLHLYLRVARLLQEIGEPVDASAAFRNLLETYSSVEMRDYSVSTQLEEIGRDYAQIAGKESLPELLEVLGDPNLLPEIRAGVAGGLAGLGAVETARELQRIAEDRNESEGLRLASASSLADLGFRSEATPVLEDLLVSPSLHARLGAAEKLVELGAVDEAIPVLRDVLGADVDQLQAGVTEAAEGRLPFDHHEILAFANLRERASTALARAERIRSEAHLPAEVKMGNMLAIGVVGLTLMGSPAVLWARAKMKAMKPDAVGMITASASAGQITAVRALVELVRSGNESAVAAVKRNFDIRPLIEAARNDPEARALLGELAALGHADAARAHRETGN